MHGPTTRVPPYVPTVTCDEAERARAIAARLDCALAEEVLAHLDACPETASHATPDADVPALPPELTQVFEADWEQAEARCQAIALANDRRAQHRLALLVLLGRRAANLRAYPDWLALGRLRSDPAREPDAEVRRAALTGLAAFVVALHQTGPAAPARAAARSAVDSLLHALAGDPSTFVRQTATAALANVAPYDGRAILGLTRALNPAAQPDPDVRHDAVVGLIEAAALEGPAGGAVRDTLVHDPAWDVRRAAAHALGRATSSAALAALAERGQQETDPEVLAAIAQALGEHPEPPGTEADRAATVALAALIQAPATSVRGTAAAALARRYATSGAGPDLVCLLQDDDPVIRRGALHGLPGAALERPDVAARVQAALADDDSATRAAAIVALARGERLEPAARERIASLGTDPAWLVREAASRALGPR